MLNIDCLAWYFSKVQKQNGKKRKTIKMTRYGYFFLFGDFTRISHKSGNGC